MRVMSHNSMFGSNLILAAAIATMLTPSISAATGAGDHDDDNFGGASGGSGIDRGDAKMFDDTTDVAGTATDAMRDGQMHQAMGGGPESDDNKGDDVQAAGAEAGANEQADADLVDAAEADDKPAGGEQQGD